jgi:hypothetical protein
MGKVKIESEASEKKKSTLPPFDDVVDPNDSDVEENMSSKSDVSRITAFLLCLSSFQRLFQIAFW